MTDEVLAAGERIDRYVTLERLGTGGMGVVYSAYDPELNRKVALKLIRARTVGASMQERLLREAQAMAQVTHPNVAAVFDVGRHGEQLFVAMEPSRARRWRRGWRASADRAPRFCASSPVPGAGCKRPTRRGWCIAISSPAT